MANEVYKNNRKVAFTVHYPKDQFFPNLGDVMVMEESTLGGDAFKQTASFLTEHDAVVYLQAKYKKK